MAKKVKIIKEQCIGCGACNAISPVVFDWDDDGTMKVVAPEVEGELADQAVEAEASCPTSAIVVE
ncbi:MAG: ferredoxin [Bacilli bacterium]